MPRPGASAAERDGGRLLVVSAAVFVVAQLAVMALGFVGVTVSNITHAYVIGESHYSKAQKEAVVDLMRYARTGDERDYLGFVRELDVLKGDRDAREALSRADPDLQAAERGFLRGRNSPADVPHLIIGFRLFQRLSPFAAAVADWRAADEPFLALERLADDIRRRAGRAEAPATAEDLAAIDRLNGDLTRLEQTFSEQMGVVVRLADTIGYLVVVALGLLVCCIGLFALRRVQRILVRTSIELVEAKDRAEALGRAKTDFLANISHEIRTPLNSIIGFGDLLEMEGLAAKGAQKYLARIRAASAALLVLVNDILDFSALETGRIDLKLEKVDLRPFVEEVLALVQDAAEPKGLELAGYLSADAPAVVMADSGRLRQVLLALLGNAIKFTDRGRVVLKVGYRAESLRFDVVDTGIGIDRASIPRLFDRFSQADDSMARKFGGAGLGLAISKSLVELMGGIIGVASEEGVGSTFWFTVPALTLEDAAPQAAGEEIAPAERAPKILVVDDVELNRELLKTILSVFDVTIREAPGGVEAVAAASQEAFDLILMDLQMPVMDGLSATRAIRSVASPNTLTPIVAVTANVLAEHRQACFDAGMDDFLGKPVSPQELITAVSRWVGQKSSCDAPKGRGGALLH